MYSLKDWLSVPRAVLIGLPPYQPGIETTSRLRESICFLKDRPSASCAILIGLPSCQSGTAARAVLTDFTFLSFGYRDSAEYSAFLPSRQKQFRFALFRTRLAEQCSLSFLHTPLPSILPEGACSLLRRAHPNGRTAESVSPAHDVDIQPVREQMLFHHVPTARAFFPHYPIVIVRGYGA